MVSNSADVREVTVQHTCNAPREVVFRAWTEQELVAQWWGPHCFTNPVCEIDARPGGKLRIHMQSPDGTIYPMTGIYHEVIAPERLVFSTSALDAQGNSMFDILNVVTFAEQGAQTVVTLTGTVTNATPVAKQYLGGMRPGMEQQLERLAELVSKTEGQTSK